MKKIIFIIIIFIIFSCKEKKVEFIQSPTLKPHFLLKNPPVQDLLLENEIKNFLIENLPSNLNSFPQVNFYKYTSNTKYFLKHEEDPGGFSSEELGNYPEDKLAVFSISKCKSDSTKLVGQLYFYKDDFFEADTLIYKCK